VFPIGPLLGKTGFMFSELDVPTAPFLPIGGGIGGMPPRWPGMGGGKFGGKRGALPPRGAMPSLINTFLINSPSKSFKHAMSGHSNSIQLLSNTHIKPNHKTFSFLVVIQSFNSHIAHFYSSLRFFVFSLVPSYSVFSAWKIWMLSSEIWVGSMTSKRME